MVHHQRPTHLCRAMPGTQWETASERQLHEAHTLKLDSSKAKSLLGWYPRWSLAQALDKTVAWHQAWKKGRDMSAFCLHQIHEYEKAGQA